MSKAYVHLSSEPRLARDAPPAGDDATALRPDAYRGVEALERPADFHAVGEEAADVYARTCEGVNDLMIGMRYEKHSICCSALGTGHGSIGLALEWGKGGGRIEIF